MMKSRAWRLAVAAVALIPGVVLVLGDSSSAEFADVEQSPSGTISIGVIDVGRPSSAQPPTEGSLDTDGDLTGSPSSSTTALPPASTTTLPPSTTSPTTAPPTSTTTPTTTTTPSEPPPPPVKVTFDNVAPGDVIIRELTITNSGGETKRYALENVVADASFHAHLGVDAFPGDCASATWPGSPAVGVNQLLGDPAPGEQAGDRVLAAGASEVICLRYTIMATLPNSFQGTVYDAEVTARSEGIG